jgi:hypothetical protein
MPIYSMAVFSSNQLMMTVASGSGTGYRVLWQVGVVQGTGYCSKWVWYRVQGTVASGSGTGYRVL